MGNRSETEGAHSLNRRRFRFPNCQRNKEWLCVNPPLLFFKKLSYTCLVVTHIFSHWKKTELCLENFLGEKLLKYNNLLNNSTRPSPAPRTQPLWHIVFPSSGLRSPSILHGLTVLCPVKLLWAFMEELSPIQHMMIYILLFPSERNVIVKALATL